MLWCLLLLLQSSPPPSTGYIGSAACKTCHPDVWSTFFKNPHYKTLVSDKWPAEHKGCEGCHGPGKAHVEARGGKTTIPRAFSLMSPKATIETCTGCHYRDLGKVNIRRSEHTLANVACNSCHSVHRPADPRFLLAKTQRELCYGCHAPVRAQFSMPSKHRVNEGFMQCTDCHNPHGTFAPTWRMGQRPRMVSQSLTNEEACLKCHSDKRGPFLFEHAPARVEGCETCHSPHGSTNPRLLRRAMVFTLCLECHNGSGSSGLTGNGAPTQTASHNMLDPRYHRCTQCHVRIHGSNADARFFR